MKERMKEKEKEGWWKENREYFEQQVERRGESVLCRASSGDLCEGLDLAADHIDTSLVRSIELHHSEFVVFGSGVEEESQVERKGGWNKRL